MNTDRPHDARRDATRSASFAPEKMKCKKKEKLFCLRAYIRYCAAVESKGVETREFFLVEGAASIWRRR